MPTGSQLVGSLAGYHMLLEETECARVMPTGTFSH
jgi:hypothetical protein